MPAAPASDTSASAASAGVAARRRRSTAGRSRRRRRGGSGSTTSAPPIVAAGEQDRITRRSSRPAATGDSSRSWASALCPGASGPGSSRRTRARTSALAACTRTRAPSLSGFASGSRRSSTSSIELAARLPGRTSTSPRASSAVSAPARLTAVRVPACDRPTLSPWTCSPRTRARRPAGRISSSSPTARLPATSVPVTTVPKPFIVNTRSIGSRSRPAAGRGARLARELDERRPAARRARSRCAPRRGRSAVPPGTSPPRAPCASSSATAWAEASAASHFVSTTTPRGTPSSRQMSKCSRVCGITDSSAATTSITASTPWAPGEHVAHEALVARHVDERSDQRFVELRVGEAEVDRDAALFLFLQPVRVGAGERAHERALAVVDVPGRADDE